MKTLMERALLLREQGIFLGGGIKSFEIAGRKVLITLLSKGLLPNSKVLDIGCGCLRCGYWLIHFLQNECYFGIEPNIKMLDAGIRVVLDPYLVAQKRPRFDHNADFNFSIFMQKFDFFLARSIWTHASKRHIQTMLDGFVNTSNENSKFLTSYKKLTASEQDYMHDEWIGKSHESDKSGMVCHSFEWIKDECATRNLVVQEIEDATYNFGKQTWILIEHRNQTTRMAFDR